jgi:hypothetical protein
MVGFASISQRWVYREGLEMVHGVPGDKLPFASLWIMADAADGGVVSQRKAILRQSDADHQTEYSL